MSLEAETLHLLAPVIILYGPVTCGKDTLDRQLPGHRISTGDMVRKFSQERPELAKRCSISKRGKLVDDELIISWVFEGLPMSLGNKPLKLNGVPRTPLQAERIIPRCRDMYGEVHVLHLDHINLKECLKRAKIRRKIAIEAGEEPRPDDKPKVVRERYSEYQKLHLRLFPVFQKHAEIHTLDAKLPPEVIREHALRIIYG